MYISGENQLYFNVLLLCSIKTVAVAESAAVAMPHNVKGEALYCFVTLRDGFEFSTQLESELKLKGAHYTYYVHLIF